MRDEDPATAVPPVVDAAGAAPTPPTGVTRPIGRELLRLAAPICASQLLRIAYQWVDALWVRGLGVEATAAVTTSVFVLWAVYSLQDAIGLGVSAYVSQLLGAGDRRRAGLAAWKGLRAIVLLGLVGTAAGLFAPRQIYGLMHADPRVAEQGARYLAVVLTASPIPMVALMCEAVMRASGDTRTPFAIDLFAVTLNAILDPFLIYGWGPFPKMGIAGAAWATVIAQAIMVACYLTLAARRHRAFPLARSAPGAAIRVTGMARVGIPGALIGILFSVVYVLFARAAGAYGPAAMAVVGFSNRIEALHFVGVVALGGATATLVGQNLGAGRPDRAVEALKTANLWSLWISLPLVAAFMVAPHFFISLFTADPEAHRLGAPYLRILSACLPFVGVEITTAEGIMGSGHTTVISAIFTIFSLLRVPLALLVPRWTGAGVLGIAWVITITCLIRTAIILGWVSRGTWKGGLARELGVEAT